jgi:hypothetical protein
LKAGELLSGGEQSWFMGKSRVEVDTRLSSDRELSFDQTVEHSGNDPGIGGKAGAKYDKQSQEDLGTSMESMAYQRELTST